MGTNSFPTYNQAKWIRQTNRVYYERRWNADEDREERKRWETITAYRECQTSSTMTAEFNGFFNQRELPTFTVNYSGGEGNAVIYSFEAFDADDVDVYDYGTGVSRVTLTASKGDEGWYYKDEDGNWVDVEEDDE